MPQVPIDNDNCNTRMWCMFNGQLLLYPKAGAGASVEMTGYLKPPKYTLADTLKEVVTTVTDSTTMVQGPSDEQMRLIRFRVIRRLFEDAGNMQLANYYANRIREAEHELNMEHEDSNYTDSTGRIISDG